ncbi:hypothetical protein DPEC_G00120530 [Dallia pectoralis]|uniref:Uncharacterized protein n=1 Tax=Dallia pectoralis TaxID=75939 RepID=A0ACC2GPR4_DALPE|nr:hypothetical protein DPEC_G00120530 [Dallia pectoralis]
MGGSSSHNRKFSFGSPRKKSSMKPVHSSSLEVPVDPEPLILDHFLPICYYPTQSYPVLPSNIMMLPVVMVTQQYQQDGEKEMYPCSILVLSSPSKTCRLTPLSLLLAVALRESQ